MNKEKSLKIASYALKDIIFYLVVITLSFILLAAARSSEIDQHRYMLTSVADSVFKIDQHALDTDTYKEFTTLYGEIKESVDSTPKALYPSYKGPLSSHFIQVEKDIALLSKLHTKLHSNDTNQESADSVFQTLEDVLTETTDKKFSNLFIIFWLNLAFGLSMIVLENIKRVREWRSSDKG